MKKATTPMVSSSLLRRGVLVGVWLIALAACGGGDGGSTGNADHRLDVVVNGTGTVTSQPGGISCGSTCNATYSANSTVTLTATPASGHLFSAWSGACAGTTPTCTVEMSDAKSVTAAFIPNNGAGTSGWQDQTLVSAPNTFDQGYQRSAMASDGRVLATWLQLVTVNNQITGYVVWANRFTPGTGWGTPSEVTRVEPSIALRHYKLAMNDAGKGMLMWSAIRATSTSTYDLYAMPFDWTTGVWGGQVTISSRTDRPFDLSLEVGLDASGNAIATWSQPKPTTLPENGIWASRYTASGGWSTPQVLNDNVGDNGISHRLAVSANGDAFAMWYAVPRGSSGGLWTKKYTAGAWGASQLTVPVVSSEHRIGTSSAIATDRNGGAMLVWYQTDRLVGEPLSATRRGIYAMRYVNGAWTGAKLLSNVETGHSLSNEYEVMPIVALNAQNRAAVIWVYPNARSKVWANRSRSDGSWETPQMINTGMGDASYDTLRAGIDDAGNVTAAWFSDFNIFTNRYTEGAGWALPQAMAVFDRTKGIVDMASFNSNGRGDVMLVYQLHTDIGRHGAQVFSRYYRAVP